MAEKPIFIHIPKTGGTTINCLVEGSDWQTTPDFNYRHIIYETKKSNSRDIFDDSQNDQYLDYSLYMMVRHPVDRLVSEYHFIKDRGEFMSLLKPHPKDFESFLANKQTANYMLRFLLGMPMYGKDVVGESHLEQVKIAVEKLNIHIGIFEEFSRSIRYLEGVMGMKFPKKVERKRMTLSRPAIDEIPRRVADRIEKMNRWDMAFYEWALERFNRVTVDVDTPSIDYTGDRYDYVLKYTERFCLLMAETDTAWFIKNHVSFFDELRKYLHKRLQIKDGRTYVQTWLSAFKNALDDAYPDSPLNQALASLYEDQEPLIQLKEVARLVNKYGRKIPESDMMTGIVFSERFVPKIKRSGWGLGSLFRRK